MLELKSGVTSVLTIPVRRRWLSMAILVVVIFVVAIVVVGDRKRVVLSGGGGYDIVAVIVILLQMDRARGIMTGALRPLANIFGLRFGDGGRRGKEVG